MKFFRAILSALLVAMSAPEGREWSAAADAIFTREGL